MGEVDAVEAAARLNELLDAVEAGERITIARGGRAVAVLTPLPRRDARSCALAITALREFRRGKLLGGLRDALDEGRR